MTSRSTARLDSVPAAGASGEVGEVELRHAVAALQDELRETREAFVLLRETLQHGERKGNALSEAFRQVLADMTELFQAQREENLKREESLRFFLSSIEARLMNCLRAGGLEVEAPSPGAEAGEDGGASARRRWPFGRSGRGSDHG